MRKEVLLSTVSILTLLSVNAQAASDVSSDPYHLSGGTAASTNSTLIKAGFRKLDWIYAGNPTATGAYMRTYNLSGAPTCSTSGGVTHVFPIPPNWGGFIIQPTLNETYVSGIGFCITGGIGDTDATNAPSGITIEGGYR